MSDPVTGTTDVDFIRSTTVTTVDRELDGDTSTRVEHTARFAVKPGSVTDQLVAHGRRKAGFQPRWLEVVWLDGRLREVRLTGPQRLKDTGLSEAISKTKYWHDGFRREPLERADLPQLVRDAIVAYERSVAETTSGGPA